MKEKKPKGTEIPDHEFIVTTVGIVVYICGREQVIRDIGADIGVVVAPFHRTRNTSNLTDMLLIQVN